MSEDAKVTLIGNIAEELIQVREDIKERMVSLFKQVDEDYGDRIA